MNSQNRSNPIDLSRRRMFITGGTGIVGRSLLDYIQEGLILYGGAPQVTILSRSPERFYRYFPNYIGLPWLNVIQGDLFHLPIVASSFYTDIIHAAADTHLQGDPMAWITQLVEGTTNVLRFASKSNVERMLFISSGAVYGSQPTALQSLSEDHYFAPLTTDVHSTYSHGKRMAEHICALHSAHPNGPFCVIARCFSIVSQHIPLNGPYALGNFMRDAIAGRGIHISGDGKTIRSYIEGRDLAHWIFTLLCHGARGEAYNVGSDLPITTLELATIIRDVVNIDQPIKILALPDCDPRKVYLPNVDKASTLGLSIETSLRDALTDIERILRS